MRLSLLRFIFIVCLIVLSNDFAKNSKDTNNVLSISCKISGIIVDSASTKPIEYAIVTLLDNIDGKVLTGLVTSSDGSFVFDKLNTADYRLKISVVGYRSKVIKSVVVTEKNPAIDLGRLQISPTTITLDEISVNSRKERIEYLLDKVSINVDKQLAAPGNTIIDILRNAPLIQIDAFGNVNIRGNGNVTILLDGKVSLLTDTEILSQIPAATVERIDIITNPSARFDAEGTAGIVNIVTRKQQNSYWNGMLTSGIGTKDNYNFSSFINYKPSNITYFGNYDFKTSYIPTESSFILQSLNPSKYSETNSVQHSSSKRYSHNLRFGMKVIIDDKNSLTTSLQYNNGTSTLDQYSQYQNFGSSQQSLENYINANHGNRKGEIEELAVNYKKNFDAEGKELNCELFLSNVNNNNNNLLGTDYTLPLKKNSIEQNTISDNSNKFISLAVDYGNPLEANRKLELGCKSVYRIRKADYNVFDQDTLSKDYFHNENLSNDFSYQENINSAYLLFSSFWSAFNYQVGIRVENTNIITNQLTLGQKNTQTYTDVFPSVHISRNIDDIQSLSMSYSRRIERPLMYYLNPFLYYYSPQSASAGNPNLKPAYTNSFELGYTYSPNAWSLYLTIFYRENVNGIGSVAVLSPENVFISTQTNNSEAKNYGMDISTNFEINNWLNLATNLSFYRNNCKESNYYNEVFSVNTNVWNAGFNATIKFWYGVDMLLNGFYTPDINFGINKIKSTFSSSILIKKTFLENSLTCSLKLTDPFHSVRYDNGANDNHFLVTNTFRPDNNVLSINISYSFNKYRKINVKKPDDDTGASEYLMDK